MPRPSSDDLRQMQDLKARMTYIADQLKQGQSKPLIQAIDQTKQIQEM